MSDAERPHSERHFTDARDHWWNDDYLELLARRLRFRDATTLLEVGVGQGHFARALAPHFAPGFELTGVDREERSLAVARECWEALAAARRFDGHFHTVVAAAEALPFAGDSFDMVFCQTLLIHLRSPEAGFREMVRVCKPGGLVLAVEPNNLAGLQRLARDGTSVDPTAQLREVLFTLRCTRGKALLGLGWNHAGMLLPALFAELDDVRYYQNDRPWVLAPPYRSPQEVALLADVARAVEEGVYGWERDEARRYYVAGGGTNEDFDADYDALLARQRADLEACRAGRAVELTAFAGLIAAGRKPRESR